MVQSDQLINCVLCNVPTERDLACMSTDGLICPICAATRRWAKYRQRKQKKLEERNGSVTGKV